MLPGLVVLESSPLDNTTAEWGLRALDTLTANNIDDAVVLGSFPKETTASSMKGFEPPLATWLNALAMRLLGPAHSFSSVAVNFLASSGVVGMTFVLISRLLGARIGFWTVILFALQPTGLSLVRAPAPVSLTLFCFLVSFWAILRHRERKNAWVSYELLIAGIAVGLGWLAGGVVAIVPTGLLAVLALVNGRISSGKDRRESGIRPSRQALLRLVVVYFAIILSAFMVSGWWLQLMHSRYGIEFWNHWDLSILYGMRPANDSLDKIQAGEKLIRISSVLGILGLVSLFGMGQFLWELLRPGTAVICLQRRLFLITWAIMASGLWWLAVGNHQPEAWQSSFWAFFLLIPLMSSAGYVIDSILQRRLGLPVIVALVIASPLCFTLLNHDWSQPGNQTASRFGLNALLAIVAGLGGWGICRYAHSSEIRNRFVIGGLVLGLILGSVGMGIRSLQSADDLDDLELQTFLDQLGDPEDYQGCLLIAGKQDPSRLVFAVRSHLSNARFKRVETWDAAFQSRFVESLSESQTAIVVEWRSTSDRPTKIDVLGFDVKSIAAQRYFQGKELRAFELQRTPLLKRTGKLALKSKVRRQKEGAIVTNRIGVR